jgi:ATP-binding cassette subfamily B protein
LHFRPVDKFHINFNHENSLEIFKLQKWLVVIVIISATIAQLLTCTDPIILGKIIDNYATNLKSLSQLQLLNGVLYWLGIAIAIAVAARIAKVFQQCVTRQAVQQFGRQISTDGLKQTLRWCFQEY